MKVYLNYSELYLHQNHLWAGIAGKFGKAERYENIMMGEDN
jgi:hypothetical protein